MRGLYLRMPLEGTKSSGLPMLASGACVGVVAVALTVGGAGVPSEPGPWDA